MSTEVAKPLEFHLHFEGKPTREHTIPATVLAQAIQQVQRAVHLLAFAHEGREFKERLRPSHEFERKYVVQFKVPQDGGYDIPYSIGGAGNLFGQPAAVVVEQYVASLAAIQQGDVQSLKRAIPLAPIRRQFLTSLKNMQPPRRSGIYASIEDDKKQKILDGRSAAARLEPLLNEPTIPSVQPRVVTGRLDALDFQSRTLTLSLFSGRPLKCTYGDDFEPVLVENRREWIQVRGEAVLNDDDSLRALNNVSEIIVVDDSEISVDTLTLPTELRAASRPLAFKVSFDPESGIYTATGDFHMMVAGETREELETAVSDALEFLWRTYVLAEASNFSADAMTLRERLSEAFSEVKNDA